ncbi:MAG: hypothetical protein JNK53_04450, partial [Phycisphaerae bacterium]|nr:hypothetical protein [Phycisphaerae bacterium]
MKCAHALERWRATPRWPAIVGVLAIAMVAWSAAADTVERRGTAEPIDGTVLRVGPSGVSLRVTRNGLDREETVPWSDVRSVQGASIEGLAMWHRAGEALWR